MVDVETIPAVLNGTGVLGWLAAVSLMAKQMWRANQESHEADQAAFRQLLDQAQQHAVNIAESHGKIATAQQSAIDLLTASVNRAHEQNAWSQSQERECEARCDKLQSDLNAVTKELAALKRQLAQTTSQTAATRDQVAAMAEKVPA